MKVRRLVVLLATVLTVLVTGRLGLWQLGRAADKTALQQAVQRQRALPPLDAAALARTASAATAQLHRSVQLEGRWSDDGSVFLENRTMGGRTGFYVLTPLLLPDGRAVLVQRGFVPRVAADRTRIAVPPPPPGVVKVFGRLALGPSRFFELGSPASDRGPIRQNLDIDDYAREAHLPLVPLLVVQEDGVEPAVPPDGLERHWPVPAADAHKHYGYAFQWFALAALVLGLYVWFQLVRPRILARAARAYRP